MIEPDKFEDTYQAQANSIFKFLLFRTNDFHLAEDLTSTTFEKAWQKRSSYRGGSIQAWLHKIARNTLIDHWRKTSEIARSDLDSLLVDVRPGVEAQIDHQLMTLKLKRALLKLPLEMRRVVYLRFIAGLPSKEVAKRLNLTDANTRIIQYRALKKLRSYLE